jgi:energy-coupling factor transport system substrate-specific component
MLLKQKTKQKSDQKTIVITKQKFDQSIKRKLMLGLALTGAGVAGRVAFQTLPSIEPLTPIAILTGFLLGPIAGFLSGVTGFFTSNFFVWGGQGPWTIFQTIGAGLAGLVGGFLGIGKKTRAKIITATIIGIISYEAVVTVGTGALMSLFSIPIIPYILTSIPFMLIHLISSIGFSVGLYEFKDKLSKLTRGELIEKEIFGIKYTVNSSINNIGRSITDRFYARKLYRKGLSKGTDKYWIRYDRKNN